MASLEEIMERLDKIENQAATSPGAAQDELESVIVDLGETIADRQNEAHARSRNEDFPGTAQILGENALALQRTAALTLEIREQVRRRR